MVDRTILSLCDHTGTWSAPYLEAGYRVLQVDIKGGDPASVERVLRVDGGKLEIFASDVRLMEHVGYKYKVHGIIAAPPCDHFSVSGAQYWPAKDADGRTLAGIGIADACLRMALVYKPAWWAVENPVGRLRRYWGPPAWSFDPCDYGGWMAPDERSTELAPLQDAYTKKTLIWGTATQPEPRPVPSVKSCAQGSWLQTLGGKSERTKTLRSTTPVGFSRAFFAANP